MSLLYIVKEEKVINFSILRHHISMTRYIKLCIVLLHVLFPLKEFKKYSAS